MTLKITPYQSEHCDAVAAFNSRAKANNAPFSLSKTALSEWLPATPGRAVVRELFLALEGAEVRGGFALRRQPFFLNGELGDVANYQGPLSEGIWDRRHMMAGVQMLRAITREQPMLYALGMGGPDQPLPRLLRAANWSMEPVPFRFKVLRAVKFLRQLRPLRRNRLRSTVLDLAAFSGLGPTAIHIWQSLHTHSPRAIDYAAEVTASYGPWADDVWSRARSGLLLSAVRDSKAQNVLFGDGNPRNITLRCTREGKDIGWAVVRSTPMQGDKYFGDMRVGSLVDCLALPGEERAVVALATRHLRKLGSDLVVTNQSHAAWLTALEDYGYLSGPSNFLFACSPALAEKLGPLPKALPRIHINRADGDGPIHL